MAYDARFGKITTELGDLPADMPVLVLPATDRHMHEVMRFYWMLCARPDGTGSPSAYIDALWEATEQVETWQAEHPELVKTPGART
jgi:hypothetical protein